MRQSSVARLARIGAPTLVAALLVTGVAVAASPPAQQEVLAEPAVQTSTAAGDTAARDAQADRVNRSSSRDALSPGALAAKSAAAAKDAKAKKDAAAKKAAKAEKEAAKAKKEAAVKKKEAAEEKDAAEKKEAAEEAAAAEKAADAKAVAAVSGSRYATVALNIRTRAAASAEVRTVLKTGAKVSVTSVKDGEWQQVVQTGQAGWVRAEYLAAKKPVAKKATRDSSSSSSSGGLSGSACSSSSVESGLTADAIRVHRAICAKFPQVKSYGGVRADSMPEHPSGRALDAMISDSSVGWEIANWVRANREALGVSEIIYAQKIWTVQRGSEGWRSMSDRGSASANHYDHVHVTVYGSSGTS